MANLIVKLLQEVLNRHSTVNTQNLDRFFGRWISLTGFYNLWRSKYNVNNSFN